MGYRSDSPQSGSNRTACCSSKRSRALASASIPTRIKGLLSKACSSTRPVFSLQSLQGVLYGERPMMIAASLALMPCARQTRHASDRCETLMTFITPAPASEDGNRYEGFAHRVCQAAVDSVWPNDNRQKAVPSDQLEVDSGHHSFLPGFPVLAWTEHI